MKKILSATIFGLMACASLSASATVFTRYMNAGELLQKGDSLVSYNGVYHLVMQDDGNLVLYYFSTDTPNAPGMQIIARSFDTGTRGKGQYAAVQHDGNLAVYTSSNTWAWQAGTGGKTVANYRLVLEDNGRLYLGLATDQGLPSSPALSYRVLGTDRCESYVLTANYVAYDANGNLIPITANCGDTATLMASNRGARLAGYSYIRP